MVCPSTLPFRWRSFSCTVQWRCGPPQRNTSHDSWDSRGAVHVGLRLGHSNGRSAYPGQPKISSDETAYEVGIICWEKRYKNCLRPNRQHFIRMKSGNLWAVEPNALKIRVVTVCGEIRHAYLLCDYSIIKWILTFCFSSCVGSYTERLICSYKIEAKWLPVFHPYIISPFIYISVTDDIKAPNRIHVIWVALWPSPL
jgi:hypothetical protein